MGRFIYGQIDLWAVPVPVLWAVPVPVLWAVPVPVLWADPVPVLWADSSMGRSKGRSLSVQLCRFSMW